MKPSLLAGAPASGGRQKVNARARQRRGAAHGACLAAAQATQAARGGAASAHLVPVLGHLAGPLADRDADAALLVPCHLLGAGAEGQASVSKQWREQCKAAVSGIVGGPPSAAWQPCSPRTAGSAAATLPSPKCHRGAAQQGRSGIVGWLLGSQSSQAALQQLPTLPALAMPAPQLDQALHTRLGLALAAGHALQVSGAHVLVRLEVADADLQQMEMHRVHAHLRHGHRRNGCRRGRSKAARGGHCPP